MDRAAVSTFGTPFDAETISGSDGLAVRLSEAQLDAGVGPGWDAYATSAAVLVPNFADVTSLGWTVFLSEVARTDVHAIYSLPLSIGGLKIGAVDLYSDPANTFTPDALADAYALCATAATDVLLHALRHRHDEAASDGPYSRREVHQATGMVIAQTGVAADAALLLIRAHAFATGRTVRETAADITARRTTLEP